MAGRQAPLQGVEPAVPGTNGTEVRSRAVQGALLGLGCRQPPPPLVGGCVPLAGLAASALCCPAAAACQIAAKWGPCLPCLLSLSAQQLWHRVVEQALPNSSTLQPPCALATAAPLMLIKLPAPRLTLLCTHP